MFASLWKRKPKPAAEAPYPLALELRQVAALREWRSGEGFAAWQHICEELARQRVVKLLAADAAHAEFERGALSALHTVHDVVDIILAKCEELDHDRAQRRNGDDPARSKSVARFWGSPFWNWRA